MKWLIKWTLRLFVLLIVLIVALALAKDAIVKAIVERQVRQHTGMDVKIGQLNLSVISPVIRIRDFKLYNPPEFGGVPFLDVPELHIEFDRSDLFYRELHITLLRLRVAELDVVRNESGRTNLVLFSGKAAAAKPKRASDFQFKGVDVLNLSLGKLRFIDLKDPSASRELRLDVDNRIMKNVKTPADFTGLLLWLWLRNGGSLSGEPLVSPPQIVNPTAQR